MYIHICEFIHTMQVILLQDTFLWQYYWWAAWIIPVILFLAFQYSPSPRPEGADSTTPVYVSDCTVIATKRKQHWIQAIILFLRCTESEQVDVLLWILCLRNTQGFGEVCLLSIASQPRSLSWIFQIFLGAALPDKARLIHTLSHHLFQQGRKQPYSRRCTDADSFSLRNSSEIASLPAATDLVTSSYGKAFWLPFGTTTVWLRKDNLHKERHAMQDDLI